MRKKWLLNLITLCFSFHLSLGQTRIIGDRLQKLLIVHQYHCDAELNRFQSFLMHNEVPVKMLFMSFENSVDSIHIVGRVADYTSEGMIADILLATVSDSTCVMEEKLGVADINGHFKIAVKKDRKKSLYFTSLSYKDLEIKIAQIIDLLE